MKKHFRLLAGVAAASTLAWIAGCSATGSDDAHATDSALEQGTELSTEAAAAVKEATGREAVSARPIYEPEAAQPSFVEVNLAGSGWAVVTTSAPAHVVEYGLTGRSPSARLDLGARNAMKRIYRLDPAIYIAADASGNAVGRSTKTLLKIDRSGPRATFVSVTSDEALHSWRAARTDLQNAQLTQNVQTRDTPLFGGTAPDKTCSAKGDVPSYRQLDAGEGPNTTACFSGCGPTAWATVFGWASRRAAENATEDAGFAGLFRSGSTPVEAPLAQTDDVSALLMQLNHAVGTFCAKGEGATTSWGMGDVKSWVADNAPGITVDAKYNILMVPDNGVRDAVIDTLCDGRPAIVGTGTLFGGDGHYPIAKGYANGKFELEMGWGGDGNGWYDATTWYMGAVRH